MPDPLNETPTTHLGHGDSDYDTSVTYSTSELDLNEYGDSVASTREIKAEIIEEGDDIIEVELEVTDNTNKGIFALGRTTQNYAGGDFERLF